MSCDAASQVRIQAVLVDVMELAVQLTDAPGDLVGLARDEETNTVVLCTELCVEGVLEALESIVDLARDGDGRGLVAGCVCSDLVLEGIVVDIVQPPTGLGCLLEMLAELHFQVALWRRRG